MQNIKSKKIQRNMIKLQKYLGNNDYVIIEYVIIE